VTPGSVVSALFSKDVQMMPAFGALALKSGSEQDQTTWRVARSSPQLDLRGEARQNA